ncbi:MAG: HK97 gp10 family phage protein [Planctomycetaceae bacterium]|jgi:hypothetical protein|nr:HK97 gp10 family phage protein [Planctomycetaceae bacterium]
MEIELEGSNLVVAQFMALPDKVAYAVNRNAVKKANSVVAMTLRETVPVDTGTLQKSIGSVVRGYKAGKITIGITGPRNEYSQKVEKWRDYSVGKKGGKYLHVVEYIDKRTGKKRTKRMYYVLRTKTVRHLEEKNPAVKYAHLVDAGTKKRFHASGKSTGRTEGRHFYLKTRLKVEEQVLSIYADEIKKAIESL